MERHVISKGVYPTMITPFRNGEIDYKAVDQLLDYYLDAGVHGIFAVCQSSEMVNLSLREKTELASHVVKYVNGRVTVVASGHTSDCLKDQADEINAIWKTGVDAVVWVTNRLDIQNQGDKVWIDNAEKLLSMIDDDVVFGIYECPRPYKRLMSKEIIDWCLKTNRFKFIKDTCCNPDLLAERIEQLKGSEMFLFNANAQTLYKTLLQGAKGYSSIMANFQPKLYTWLVEHLTDARAEKVAETLEFCAFLENDDYPVSAKYSLQLCGIDMTLETRNTAINNFTPYRKMLVEDLLKLTNSMEKELGI